MHLPSLIEKKRDGGDLLGRNRAGHLRFYSRRNSRFPDARAGDGNFFPRYERQGNLAFDQSNAGERPDIRVSTKLAAKVDKHSTGAIGGKTSLVLAPLLACDEGLGANDFAVFVWSIQAQTIAASQTNEKRQLMH